MFVDHMHQPWRTLAACINKCLSGKTASNDKLRKSRIDILWGMFYRENVDYPSLIWEDIAYQIDHRKEKKSRREILDSQRMGEDVQQYGLAIPATMLNNDIIQSESYKMFILYSTGQIPLKKSRGKGSQGKKTTDTTEESVDVSDESDPEPLIRRKTSRRKVVKKKATISVDDNIIPEPDIALELGKSISLAEAEKNLAAKENVSKKRTSGTSQKLKGIQSLTLAEQEAADIMKALKDSKKIIGRQPGTGGSDEGTGEIPGVLDESIFADAEDDNEETESDYEDIYKYKINVRKNADIEMKDAEKTTDITKETTEQPLTSSSLSVPSDYGNQFLNLSHNEETSEQPPVLQQTTPNPTTIPTPPINTERPTDPSSIPEITPFIALQLRVAKLEQDMSEVKKIDHSAAVLASIQSQVPPVVDKYVGTKLDDALLKALERHTADLVEKYSMLPTLESSKKQESEKSPEEIIRIKREQEEKKQEPTYTIKSTDKAALEEFDLKSALFKSMHKNKSANRNPANYRLYHALMEALIEDENAMDKEVADTIAFGSLILRSSEYVPDTFSNSFPQRTLQIQLLERDSSTRSDYNEYKILEKDFKSLHPNDFEDLNIFHFQGKLDHLPKQDKVHLHNALGIKRYQTKLNLEQPNWDASDFPFKEDYTIVFKPRAFNKGMENRKWTEDDKRRSEDFIEVIERRLKIRRIFRSLESFVGGRLRDIDYRLISRTEGELYQKTDHAFYFIGDIRLVRLDNLKMEMEMEIPSVKASANSDIVYFFTSAQDGDPLQDDVRLCLADDLKKAQDHNQRQVNDESKDHYPKMYEDTMKNQCHKLKTEVIKFKPVEILEIEFKKLKRSRIAIVKVWWNLKHGPEFTWEHEDQMKLKICYVLCELIGLACIAMHDKGDWQGFAMSCVVLPYSSTPDGRPFRCIMPPRMTTQSAGRPAAASRGGGTGGQAGRGGGRTRGHSGDQSNGGIGGRGGQVGGQGSVVNDGVDGVPDFSTIIAQQLQNLLPTIVAQVGDQGRNQGNGRNQDGDAINDNTRGDVRNVIADNDHRGCTYKEFLACNPKEYDGKGGAIVYTRWIEKMESVQDMSGCRDNQKVHLLVRLSRGETFKSTHEAEKPLYVYGLALQIRGMVAAMEPKTIQKAVQIADTLTDEAFRNGSIKKNHVKGGNMRKPSKDRNVRYDNKRTRSGNAFARTTNHVGRENTGTVPKCTTCNSYHAPGVPCRTCFNCNRPSHFAKDCRVVSRNVNPVNVKNPTVARGACFEYGSLDHYKSACPMLIRAQGPGGNRPNQALANDEG
ncbi:retrovirus-related pol polyprotein from transposon TNT 1-94 [Tanacetum coccineum]